MSDIDLKDFYKERKAPQARKPAKQKRNNSRRPANNENMPYSNGYYDNYGNNYNGYDDNYYNGGNRGGNGGNHKKKRRKLKIWVKILIALLVLALIGCMGVFIYAFSVIHGMEDWSIESLNYSSTTFLIDHEGNSYESLHSGENRIPVDIEDVPQQLIDCFISTEDTRFYSHSGVDIIRVFGAALADLKSGNFSQGASTLTMQLARNAILEDQSKQVERKIKEAYIALQIEKQFNKDEILELYLNTIYFGEGAYGIEAAARTYFGKHVQDLSLSECAVITGLVRNPSLYSPIDEPENAKTVRNQVLDNLISYDKDTYQESAEAAKNDEIVVAQYESDNDDFTYPWFTDYVISEAEDILISLGIDESTLYTGGYKIYTTVDNDVQALMEEGYANNANFPTGTSSTNKVESAMAVLNNETGEIRGLIGGREHTTKRAYNRATDMKRQPGSTFKPIAVYAPAIENGYSPASVVNDVLTDFGGYQPTNYDGRYRGVISMRESAVYSVNIPAVKFLQKIGVDTSMAMIEKMGISMADDQNTGLSLALGGMTYGVSPLEMAAAYACFSNGGNYNEPYAIKKIENSKGELIYQHEAVSQKAMEETTAYLVTDMLISVTERGTGTRAQITGMEVASKTGTVQLPKTKAFAGITSGNKDAWFAAYTPELTGVVWMGYDNDLDESGKPQYLQQEYGGKYPAIIWQKVIGTVSYGSNNLYFDKPAGITSITVDTKSGKIPSSLTPSKFTKGELFAATNAPSSTSSVWKQVKICTKSNMIAGSHCASTQSTVRYVPPEEPSGNTIKGSPDDTSWLYTSNTCNKCQ